MILLQVHWYQTVGHTLNLNGSWELMSTRSDNYHCIVDWEAVLVYGFDWLPPTKTRKGFALNHKTKAAVVQWCKDHDVDPN